MSGTVDQAALDTLFFKAHTATKWQDKVVPDDLLHRAWDIARMAPTSANCQPARLVFVRSAEAKARLKPALAPGNVEKTMAAPVTAIIGFDMEFYQVLPRTFPQTDARSWFLGNQALIDSTAFRNSTLQGGYFILACRAVGLDCGAMSGFDNAAVDAAFFSGSTVKSNFLINIGFADPAGFYPRNPRLEFAEACQVV
jgi:3-hydroxypropanoate dehydrogenase